MGSCVRVRVVCVYVCSVEIVEHEPRVQKNRGTLFLFVVFFLCSHIQIQNRKNTSVVVACGCGHSNGFVLRSNSAASTAHVHNGFAHGNLQLPRTRTIGSATTTTPETCQTFWATDLASSQKAAIQGKAKAKKHHEQTKTKTETFPTQVPAVGASSEPIPYVAAHRRRRQRQTQTQS